MQIRFVAEIGNPAGCGSNRGHLPITRSQGGEESVRKDYSWHSDFRSGVSWTQKPCYKFYFWFHIGGATPRWTRCHWQLSFNKYSPLFSCESRLIKSNHEKEVSILSQKYFFIDINFLHFQKTCIGITEQI